MKPLSPIILVVLLCATALPLAGESRGNDFRTEFQQSLTTVPEAKTLTVRGNVYVPSYSIPRIGDQSAGLATLLRIDNTSSSKPLVIERIDYFSSSGALVQNYLDNAIALKPLGAIQILIEAEDTRGGSAPNFMVTWAGSGPIAEPLIEAVSFGSIGGKTYSLVSRGRAIKTVGKRQWYLLGPSR